VYERNEILDEFAKICWQLRIEYDVFCSLFDRGEQYSELLQKTAPYLFGDLYGMVRSQLFVGFCRITDPSGSGERVNLTTNYIVKMDWPREVRANLNKINGRLMSFREYVEPARNKRIAHMDLRSQMEKEKPLGAFPPGADIQFFKDLEEFLTVAYHAVNGGPFLLSIGGGNDTHQLFRALVKATLFDQCGKCKEIDRANAILDVEQEMRNH
jgi:hypothetical protein